MVHLPRLGKSNRPVVITRTEPVQIHPASVNAQLSLSDR
jgi:hypothetical protein